MSNLLEFTEGKHYMRCPACDSGVKGNNDMDTYDVDKTYECASCKRFFKFLLVDSNGTMLVTHPRDGELMQARLEEIN